MTTQGNQKRVLAFDVRLRRFGFVAFEGPDHLLDWGVRSFYSGACAVKIPAGKKIRTLIDDFSPSVIVVRERGGHGDAPNILKALRREASSRKIPLRFISRKAIMKAFAGTGKNKHEVAAALAQQFSILMSKLPRRQKCWQSEDYRMGIFDAAAVGVAYFTRRRFHQNQHSGKHDKYTHSPDTKRGR
jgi:hypothetical protein